MISGEQSQPGNPMDSPYGNRISHTKRIRSTNDVCVCVGGGGGGGREIAREYKIEEKLNTTNNASLRDGQTQF